jgi:hypothetical protein
VRGRDSACLGGLSFVYRLAQPVDTGAVVGLLQEAFDGKLAVVEETLGDRPGFRLFLPRRVEFRVGLRPEEVVLIHRVSASEEARERDRLALEAVLDRL